MTGFHRLVDMTRIDPRHALATAVGVLLGLSPFLSRPLFSAPPSDVVSLLEDGKLAASYHSAVTSGHRMSTGEARAFEARFLAVKTVRLTDGFEVSTDNSAEIAAMKRIVETPNGSEPDENTRMRAAILDHLVNPEKNAVPLTGDPGEVARGLLKHSEFDFGNVHVPDAKLNWLHRWLDRIGDAIARWLDHLFGGPHPKAPDGPSLSGLAAFIRFFFIALLVIAGAAAVAFLGLKIYQNRDRLRRKSAVRGASDLDLGPDEVGDPIAAAHRLADRGDFRGAIRLAYIASLRALADSGAITITAYRTNWEYQRELSTKAAQKSAIFRPATALFDRVWYGHRNGTPAEFAQIVAIYEKLAGVVGASPDTADNDGRLVGNAQDGR